MQSFTHVCSKWYEILSSYHQHKKSASNVEVHAIIPGAPTLPPTRSPTRRPTSFAPTPGPTRRPGPTKQPTRRPTPPTPFPGSPTLPPTPFPTRSPTQNPTPLPTPGPGQPTRSPTRFPTQNPTPAPMVKPFEPTFAGFLLDGEDLDNAELIVDGIVSQKVDVMFEIEFESGTPMVVMTEDQLDVSYV